MTHVCLLLSLQDTANPKLYCGAEKQVVLQRTLNLCDAPSTGVASYIVYKCNRPSDMVSFSRVLAGDGCSWEFIS